MVDLLCNSSLCPKRCFSPRSFLAVYLTNMATQLYVMECSWMTQKQGLIAVGGHESLRVLQHCTQMLELLRGNFLENDYPVRTWC